MNKGGKIALIAGGSLLLLGSTALLIDKYANDGKILAKLTGKTPDGLRESDLLEGDIENDSVGATPNTPEIAAADIQNVTLIDQPSGAVQIAEAPPNPDYPIKNIKKIIGSRFEIIVPKKPTKHQGKIKHIRILKLHPLLDGKQQVVTDKTTPSSKFHTLVVEVNSTGSPILDSSKRSELSRAIRTSKPSLLKNAHIHVLKRP